MKKILSVLLFNLLAFASLANALPFSVTPIGNLPTGIIQGKEVAAAYTVVNNTNRQLNNIFVRTPPNVSVASGGCGATFNLASKASCTLNLTITGVVNAQDPNPNNHLFVCLAKGTTCSGTNYPLNVDVLATPNFIYIGTETAGGINVCSISMDVGSFSNCTTTGANVFSQPEWLAFSRSGLQAYVTDPGQNPAVIWLCNVNTTTGALSGCQNSGATGITTPVAIILNTAGTHAYISELDNNTVKLCNVSLLTGILSGCIDSGVGNIFNKPAGITLNSDNTIAYIANSNNGTISLCTVNSSSGQLSTCISQSGFTKPFAITLIPSGTQAYVTDTQTSLVYLCSVNTNTGTLSSCVSTGTKTGTGGSYSFQNPQGITLSSSHSQPAQIYVANQGNGNVSICDYCSLNCTSGQNPGELTCMNSSKANNLGALVGITLS